MRAGSGEQGRVPKKLSGHVLMWRSQRVGGRSPSTGAAIMLHDSVSYRCYDPQSPAITVRPSGGSAAGLSTGRSGRTQHGQGQYQCRNNERGRARASRIEQHTSEHNMGEDVRNCCSAVKVTISGHRQTDGALRHRPAPPAATARHASCPCHIITPGTPPPPSYLPGGLLR